ncbi:MAG: ATP-binding cassette domain-containing protein [Polyangia bacterium]
MTSSPWPVALAHLRRESSDVVTLIVFAGFVGLTTLAVPIAVQALVGTVAYHTVLQPIFVLSLLLFGGLVLSAIVRGFEAWLLERLQQRLFVRTALRISMRLAGTDSGAGSTQSRVELVNRFFDVTTLQKTMSSLLAEGLSVTMQTTIGLLALALYHPWLLGYGILLAAALVFVITGLGRHALSNSIEQSRDKYAVAAWLESLAQSPALFRGSGAGLASAEMERRVMAWVVARRRHFRVLLRQIIGLLGIQVLAPVALLLIGGILVVNKQLSLGQLVAAEIIVSSVAAGIGKLGKTLDSAYDLVAASDKLHHVEAALPLVREGQMELPATSATTVSIRDVELVGVRGPLLTVCSLALPAGSRTAIVGPAGSGKSALLDLMHGDWAGEPTAGALLLDGVDDRALTRASRQRGLAMVRADLLFTGTVADNVSLGRPGIGAFEVQKALQRVGLWDVVTRFPEGIAMQVRDDGAPLSKAQRWLLVLARALAGQPSLLLVDGLEPLDTSTRVRILELLCDRRLPHTLVMVHHDERYLSYFDRVVSTECETLRERDDARMAS